MQEITSLAQVIGEDELSDIDKLYMKFGEEFENKFLKQDYNDNRTIEETLDLAWKVLSILPKNELDRVSPEILDKYYLE